tara:strand:+ start:1723 stop:2565 length:843 start_codon:yes stop_codon:yes gene_type:complete
MKNGKQFELNYEFVLNSDCHLGEGLYVEDSLSCWVDITKKKLFLYKDSKLQSYKLKSSVSVIYEVIENKIIIGSSEGILDFNYEDKIEKLQKFNLIQISNESRSNDGGLLNNKKIISYMNENPKLNLGSIYMVEGNNLKLIENKISIPNSFIALNKKDMLISDSYSGEIWCYTFDSRGKVKSKNLWSKVKKNISPDGGCKIKNLIFISLWDDFSIGVFDLNGNLIDKLLLQVPRPTNCKFNSLKSQLWVTTAKEGLSEIDLKKYPLSGDTFIYDLSSYFK